MTKDEKDVLTYFWWGKAGYPPNEAVFVTDRRQDAIQSLIEKGYVENVIEEQKIDSRFCLLRRTGLGQAFVRITGLHREES